jgi:mRNA interferase MazF
MVRQFTPNRGDVIWLDFDPQADHEQTWRRPALVLSPTDYNSPSGLAIVCPITNQQKGYPFEVRIPAGLPISGVVLADQVRSLDWRQRKAKRITAITDAVLAEVVAKVAALIEPDES